MSKMKAAIIDHIGSINIKEVDVPTISDKEVLLKIKYCGVCETDIKILNGMCSEFFPLIPGHEFVGYVEKTGAKVKDIKEGQFVAADINIGCGYCYFCKKGHVLMCQHCSQIGIHSNGGFAEYVKVPEDRVYILDKTVSEGDSVFIEPVSNAVRTAKRAGFTAGKSAVVIGGGSIGLLHVQMAKVSGISPVIFIGHNEAELEIARKVGADYTIESNEKLNEKVMEYTKGNGADYVVVADGTVEAYEKGFLLVRPAGKLVAFGLTQPEDVLGIKPFDIVLKEITIVSSVSAFDFEISETINLLSTGRFNLDNIPKEIYSLDNIDKAFKEANINLYKKNIIKMF